MELIVASQNPHKISEIALRLQGIEVRGLDPIQFPDELKEDGDTLEANALQKARQVHARTGDNCFADDTGLEVEALGGAPGVHSARYAGEEKDSRANMQRLLSELRGQTNRNARFRTVIALIWEGEEYLFEGICEGRILEDERGTGGFGYDPVFEPIGYQRSFAEMDVQTKNGISHRGRAVEALLNFLRKKSG